MLVQPHYQLSFDGARRLIQKHPRATIVSSDEAGLMATYGICLLDESVRGEGENISVLGHFAKADPQASAVVEGRPMMLVFDGPHGYVSASLYAPEMTRVPSTWNYCAVHLHGVPQLLAQDEALGVVQRTLDHFEAMSEPDQQWRINDERLEFAKKIVGGVVAFRLTASTFEAKAKMSQDMPPEVVARVIEQLSAPGPHHNAELAAQMRNIADSHAAD